MESKSRRGFFEDTLFKGLENYLNIQISARTSFTKKSQDVRFIEDPKEMGIWYKAFNNRQNEMHSPRIFASCLTEAGVVEAVLFAKQSGLKIITLGSIRTAPVVGLLDQKRDHMVIHHPNSNFKWTEENQIEVGPFCHTDLMYQQLIARKQILPLGNGPTVKISGYTLGGGIGVLSRELGLVCDSLTGARMVDGNGQIIDSKDDSELLWCARGGANEQLGYFTSFRFKTHSLPRRLITCQAVFEKNELGEVLEEWFAFAGQLPQKAHSRISVTATEIQVRVICWDEESENLIETVFKPFSKLKSQMNSSWIEPITPFDFLNGEPLGGNFYEKSSLGFFNEMCEVRESLLKSISVLEKSSQPGFGQSITLQTVGEKISSETLASQGAFAHRKFKFLAEINGYWFSSKESELANNSIREIQSLYGHLHEQYRNFQRPDIDNYELAYYAKNLDRLKKAKKKYDPNNIFSGPQSVRAEE